MRWTHWRLPLMLAPTLVILGALFFGGLGDGLLQSFGYQPEIGHTTLSLDAYRNLLFDTLYRKDFWYGLLLTLWVSIASTLLAVALALPCALLLRQTFMGKQLAVFLFQVNLSVPHLVIAIGMIFLFSQSGITARVAGQLGLIRGPAEFPVLVRDRYGIAIIFAYLWKELPFVGIVIIANLNGSGTTFEQVARNLGATRWQRFRYIIIPLVAPGLLSASIIVFAFVFGTYEIPQLLGVRFPRMLPGMALDFFLAPDLNARPLGMALSMIIAVLSFGAVALYLRIAKPAVRQA